MPFHLINRTLVILCLFASGILACKYAAKKDQPAISIKDKPTTEMPVPPLPVSAGDYAEDWKIVDSLEKQGLFKSALEKTEAIQARAVRDKNSPQVIKSLLYRGKYTAQLEEDGLVKAIQLFEKEEQTASQPEKSVLQSILGQLYSTYLNNQGWRLNNRTPIPDGEGGDILTWSAAQIEKRALGYYNSSVEQEGLLKDTPVESFRDILTQSHGDTVAGQALRPSLYDLLAHRALEHFANERSWMTEPAYAFKLEQQEAFAPAEIFVKTSFESRDSGSGKWLAIRLFQRILTPPGKNSAQTVAADLLRLQFAYNNSVREDRDSLYRHALESLHQTYRDHSMDAEIVYEIAQLIYGLQTGDKGQNARTAVALCEDAVRRHPDTYGAFLCRNLLAGIRSTSLTVTLEEVCLPQKNALVQLQFRNLDKVFVRVFRGNFDPDFLDNIPWDKQLDLILALPRVQQREWSIRNPGDYQPHITEIALDPLPVGLYWAVISETADFNPKSGHVSYISYMVSNLATVSYREKGNPVFATVHRQSGAPLAGVKLEFFAPRYQRKNGNDIVKTAYSDQSGFARPELPENTYAELRASLDDDTLWIGSFSRYRDHSEREQRQQVHFFTDRALYRPGQSVYFKGILFNNDKDGKPRILPNQAVTVKFYDTNDQEKASLQLRSNEFGTFNGAFTAPASGLTGQMSLRLEEASGGAYFNVEEYKRPKFEVTFQPVKDAFRLGESVTARGEAKAYAGSNIDGASVRYRVVRQARFPFWDWGWRRVIPPWRSDEMEIANGVATTDAEGRFEVKFTAVPDPSVPKKEKPVFDYTVYADVTDITGETRSSQQSISAGYVALQVDWGLGKDIDLDSLKHIPLTTNNLAGQPQAATGEITLQGLVEPAQFFISRYWENPDITTIPRNEWARMFPDYAWNEEDNPEKWEKEDYIVSVPFNTATDKTVDLNGGAKLQPGYYAVKLSTKDAYGEDVEITKIIRVWDKSKRNTQFESPSVAAEKTIFEPGETARLWLGGQPADLRFFFARELEGILQNPRWLTVNGSSNVDIPVTENDRGGIILHWFAVKNNREYHDNHIFLNVPWSNKQLKISYETFRDKLAPGQKEEWRIRISGPKKEKVAAEMVAAMYDASLDQFLPHSWSSLPYPARYYSISFTDWRTFGSHSATVRNERVTSPELMFRSYRDLEWFGFPLWDGNFYSMRSMAVNGMALESAPAVAGEAPKKKDYAFVHDLNPDVRYDADEEAGQDLNPYRGNMFKKEKEKAGGGDPAAPPQPVRRNLNETVFFFPELRTDKDGNVVLKFTMNEALTRWKLLTYAHTKELQQAISVKEVVTQKELMVLANAPRFLRAGDAMEFSAKVSNLSQEALSGKATLGLVDAVTLEPLDARFGMTNKEMTNINFSVQPGQSAPLAWKIKVPEDFTGAVTWQIFADGNKFRDGEESTIPTVSNRMLVTETLPITVRGNQTKSFVFENMSGQAGPSRKNHQYTLEFTSNPAWYAVQSLPYLMEFPHECSEQIFSRFYANTLAFSVVQKMPQIKRVYDRWKGTAAMKSNLAKNQELKYALLEETPWVLDAQSEEQQKQNIALLFDLNRMSDERERAVRMLSERQTSTGGWAWFPGGEDSWYITQHIVGGFGHLKQLGAFDDTQDQTAAQMLDRALGYCDAKMAEQYRKLEELVKQGKAKWEDDHLDGMVIHYLYARSFFPTQVDKPGREISYYLGQAEKYWLGKGLYQEGMLALALHRNGRTDASARIVASLRERALTKEELGMFWPVDWGFYWYQLPVETQALMVEVFGEAGNDRKSVEELRIWLLKNKQTNRWESTKATAEAVYALLLFGDNWLNNTRPVQVSLGGKALKPAEYEAGTGYFKQTWKASEVKNSWNTIKVENPNSNIVWGAAYWQYFDDLDKIKNFQKTPLTIVKQLFTEENSPTGPVLKPVAEGQALKRGDKIKVRIEIRVDRAMEFVHLKDMRAAGFEPVNVLSGYRWQGGLGYYESTKDLATHFFIDYLPRGTFVFEYPLVVTHKGDMSNGVTTMQCMYAPEFTSHSEGVRVKVE